MYELCKSLFLHKDVCLNFFAFLQKVSLLQNCMTAFSQCAKGSSMGMGVEYNFCILELSACNLEYTLYVHPTRNSELDW